MNVERFSWRNIVVAELALVAVVVAAVTLLVMGARGADADHAMGVPTPVTVVLGDIPELAPNYHYAAEHREAFTAIPCYCGCDRMLGHRTLFDCYVTRDGGWDAHASGCMVCVDETDTARSMLDAGATVADTAAAIIEQYGTPPPLFGLAAQNDTAS